MAVTTQYSTQVTNRRATPPVVDHGSEIGGRSRKNLINFTQSGAGDATSLAVLAHLPAGRIRVYEVVVKHSAFGAARTGDLGHLAYTDNDDAAVAADPDAISADADVSAAGTIREVPLLEFVSKGGVDITFQCNDGTLPDGATLDGYIEYQAD